MIHNFKKYKNTVMQDKRANRFKFSIDGRMYYVYRVTNLITNKYYYGTRIQKENNILDDFWSYCTSSCEKENIKANKSDYKIKIIKKFDNYNDCILYESFLHQLFIVNKNSKFFNKAMQNPFSFIPDRRGMINCLTIDNIPCYITSDEYQNNKYKYKTYSSGMTTCYDNDNEKYVRIPCDEYYSNLDQYSSMMQKNKFSIESKEKMKKSAKNRDTINRKKHIIIYDLYGKIKFETNGNFKNTCLQYNLPFTALKSSYQNNGEPIYINSIDSVKKMAKNKGWESHFGWFAQEID